MLIVLYIHEGEVLISDMRGYGKKSSKICQNSKSLGHTPRYYVAENCYTV
jgi:hypothetical protein